MSFFTNPVAWCRRWIPALAAVWALACLVQPVLGATWDIRKLNGEDYVSVDNIKQFYHFAKLSRKGSEITLESFSKVGKKGGEATLGTPLVVMRLNVGSPECTMNRVKFVFSKPVAEIDGKPFVSRTDLAKLIDPVLRPDFIKNAGNFRTVILDPGHGGKDPGATNPYGTEADYNLKVANLVRAEIMKLPPPHNNIRVVMTRTSDKYLSLQERVNLANSVPEDAIFISLHFNSGGRAAHGIETFTLSPPGVAHYGRDLIAADALSRAGNQHDSANVALATATHGMVVRSLGEKNTFDRGIKRARYTVLSGVRHPAILLEGGFMSHPYEARLIHKPEYQAALARGVATAVAKYRNAVTSRVKAAPPN